MRQLYTAYASTPGWWNDDGGFTLAEFLGLMLLYEISSQIDAERFLIMATSGQLWMDATSVGGHLPYCSSVPCGNGVFNFLGEFSESAIRRFTSDLETGVPSIPYGPGGLPEDGIARFVENAANFGNEILNSSSSWASYSGDRPYNWGNSSEWEMALTDALALQGMSYDQIVYWFEDFVVFTINQWVYWMSEE